MERNPRTASCHHALLECILKLIIIENNDHLFSYDRDFKLFTIVFKFEINNYCIIFLGIV